MHKNSVIEINSIAHKENIAFLRNVFGEKTIISSVVKGNAYGHGLKEFVEMAFANGVTHFSVFDVEEAKIVFDTLEDKVTILIMGFVADDDLEWVIKNQIEFFVFERYRLAKTSKIAKKLKQKAIVHIEVETGMNRTGFELRTVSRVAKYLIKEKENIYFKGLCTHYAGAESIANYFRVSKQIEVFKKAEAIFKSEGIQPKIRHSACSAASIAFPETRMDLVRIGIIQYGFWPSQEILVSYLNSKKNKIDPLQRVISWKSEVMSIKRVKSGEFIGYGTSYIARDNMKIATIPLGYSHGYCRSLSNQGKVLINGQYCDVIGTVNMNMLTVNITEINNVKKGDEVVLIGNQKSLSLSVASFSDLSNMLNYELLSRISKTIPRKILK
ncbi:alanine racemase [Flavobacterium tibetense]|uniref:Alanine racemase n=1 Tax=Flavobacterium tibetense TaxID=2233533 RepID=A0A365NZL5_9FLAO|nr:alanine racemase [Flavobacterium tibetense]RBA27523.1 alanine racemase [Flavobacterium tibetense]